MTTKSTDLKPEIAQGAELSTGDSDNTGPLGQKMAVNLSPRRLLGEMNDEVKNRVAYHPGIQELCGKMWGIITHGVSHPNGKDPTKDSIRWTGEIAFEDKLGQLGETSSAYLPNTVEKDLKAQGVPIIREGAGEKPPFFEASFSVEFWIAGVERKVWEIGYTYECWNRMGRRRNINRLAPPEVRAKLPAEPESARQLLGYEVDNETGEVTDIEQEAAE